MSKIAIINQCITKKGKLPDELLSIIKTFCFYDKQTTIQRKHKQLLINMLKTSIYISNIPYGGFDEDTDAFWHFYVPKEEMTSTLCVSCKKCGNYNHWINSLGYRVHPHKLLKCTCIRDNNMWLTL